MKTPKPSGFGPDLALLFMALVVYGMTCARSVLGGDNGEFATVAVFGGVPHPSGYPLFAIYLRATQWLPGEPAHAAALATAILGAFAVVLVRRAALAWGASAAGATLAASAFAFASLPWTMATHAEVFSLHALLAAAIVGAAGPHAPWRGLRRVGLLALLAGLGLSNNHSLVTLAPVGLYGAVCGVMELRATGLRAPAAWGRSLALGVGCLVVGLLPYASLWANADHPVWAWGHTDTWSGLLHHFLRGDYGTTSLAISDDGAGPLTHVARLLGTLTSELHYVLWVPALLGVWGLLRCREPSLRRAGPLLVLTWLLAGPGFVALFNLPVEGLSGHVVARFYLLPLTVMTVFVARGCDVLLTPQIRALHIVFPATVAVACLGLFRHLDGVREHHGPYMESYLINVVRTMPEDGVVLGIGDHEVFGFLYVQEVLGERPDVTYINLPMLGYDWYRARVERQLGFALAGASDTSIRSLDVALSILQQQRALALTGDVSPTIPRALPTYPVGAVVRVLPPGASPPAPRALELEHARLMRHYEVSERLPWDPDGWGAHVYATYARPWAALANIYEQMGLAEDAARCETNVRLLTPWRDPEGT